MTIEVKTAGDAPINEITPEQHPLDQLTALQHIRLDAFLEPTPEMQLRRDLAQEAYHRARAEAFGSLAVWSETDSLRERAINVARTIARVYHIGRASRAAGRIEKWESELGIHR